MLPAFQLALLLFFQADGSVPEKPAFDPIPAIRAAIDAADESSTSYAHFTYRKRVHLTSQLTTGGLGYRGTRNYEITWISQRPYWRLIEIDDHPLSAKEQKEEEKRYDKAISRQQDYAEEKQIEQAGYTTVETDSNLKLLLDPAYTFISRGHDTDSDGIDNRILLAELPPEAKPKSRCRWRYELWISEKDNILRHFYADTGSDANEYCTDLIDEGKFGMVSGVLKPLHYSVHFRGKEEDGKTLYTDDVTFTDYHRFATTVTIGPAHELSDKPPTPPPASPK